MLRKPVWGLLYPLKDTLPFLEMKKDEYTVGKDASCSYIIKDSQLDKIDYNLLPNKQFKISRKKNVAYLENLGVTYINEKKVDQGQKTVLKHNDRIAITKPHLTVFVYLDKSHCDALSGNFPERISEKYLVSYSLGEGGFGEVSLVFEKSTGKRYAMKTVKKQPNILKYVRTEAEILRKIRHPCVINTEEVVDTSSIQFIVLEFMEGGDLFRRVYPHKTLQEAHIKLIFFQLVLAIQYLHQQNIVHRDIKPANILLTSKRPETLIKVADFGVSKILRPGTEMDTNVGTSFYRAPEVFTNTQVYTKQVDIWSMGIVLYFCLSSQMPFKRIEDVKRGIVPFSDHNWRSVSSTVTSLIKGMLITEPAQRLGITEVLSHSWLKDQTMRRKAHNLMWPGTPYVEQKLATPSPSFQRASSLRQGPRGVLQFMTHKRTGSAQSLNKIPSPPGTGEGAEWNSPMKLAARPPGTGEGAEWNRPMKLAARPPGTGEGAEWNRPMKLAARPPVLNVGKAAHPSPKSVRSPVRPAAGVRYKPVREVIREFNNK